MKIRSYFAASALLALGLVPAAHAADEVYLRWDRCFGDGGTYNRTFACDTNSGSEVLVGSFRLAETALVSGFSGRIDITPLTGLIPPWWEFQSPGPVCRRGSQTAFFAFRPPGSSTCVDVWNPASAFSYQYFTNTARIVLQAAVPEGAEVTIPAGQETFAFQVIINHDRTTGLGSCAGCATPVCLSWGLATIVRPTGTGDNIRILGADTPGNGANVTWQTGAVATTWAKCGSGGSPCETGVMCDAITPARQNTWGQIKTLYR